MQRWLRRRQHPRLLRRRLPRRRRSRPRLLQLPPPAFRCLLGRTYLGLGSQQSQRRSYLGLRPQQALRRPRCSAARSSMLRGRLAPLTGSSPRWRHAATAARV